jgi:hypothetical protein
MSFFTSSSLVFLLVEDFKLALFEFKEFIGFSLLLFPLFVRCWKAIKRKILEKAS